MENWTVILGSILGFGGVILTLIANGRISRGAQKGQWAYENNRRVDEQKRERISLRSALLAELKFAHREVFEVPVVKDKSLPPQEQLLLKVNVSDPIYRCNCSRIGLLSEKEVDKVIDAYTRLHERSASLRVTYDPFPRYTGTVIVPLEKWEEEFAMEKKRREFIAAAISVLEEARETAAPSPLE